MALPRDSLPGTLIRGQRRAMLLPGYVHGPESTQGEEEVVVLRCAWGLTMAQCRAVGMSEEAIMQWAEDAWQ